MELVQSRRSPISKSLESLLLVDFSIYLLLTAFLATRRTALAGAGLPRALVVVTFLPLVLMGDLLLKAILVGVGAFAIRICFLVLI